MINCNKKIDFFSLVILLLTQLAIYAQDVDLPQPQKSGGMPLMEAINQR